MRVESKKYAADSQTIVTSKISAESPRFFPLKLGFSQKYGTITFDFDLRQAADKNRLNFSLNYNAVEENLHMPVEQNIDNQFPDHSNIGNQR